VNLETWAMNYDAFIEKFTIWATARPDIRAAMVIGSHARQQDPADEWSDVDIVLMARRPGVYLADARWLDQLGLVWTTNVEWAPVGGGAERRAMFEGALEVDFAMAGPVGAAARVPYTRHRASAAAGYSRTACRHVGGPRPWRQSAGRQGRVNVATAINRPRCSAECQALAGAVYRHDQQVLARVGVGRETPAAGRTMAGKGRV
jgi:predicted nucleotidyltransferase